MTPYVHDTGCNIQTSNCGDTGPLNLESHRFGLFRPRNVASQGGSIWKFIGSVYSDLALWRLRAAQFGIS